MGGYLPNPVAAIALKGAAYSALGFAVGLHSERKTNAAAFAAIRIGTGWVIGGPLLVGAAWLASTLGWRDWSILVFMIGPRLALWAALLRVCYRPLGGNAALSKWSLAGAGLSAATDAVIFGLFDKVAALRIGWC